MGVLVDKKLDECTIDNLFFIIEIRNKSYPELMAIRSKFERNEELTEEEKYFYNNLVALKEAPYSGLSAYYVMLLLNINNMYFPVDDDVPVRLSCINMGYIKPVTQFSKRRIVTFGVDEDGIYLEEDLEEEKRRYYNYILGLIKEEQTPKVMMKYQVQ